MVKIGSKTTDKKKVKSKKREKTKLSISAKKVSKNHASLPNQVSPRPEVKVKADARARRAKKKKGVAKKEIKQVQKAKQAKETKETTKIRKAKPSKTKDTISQTTRYWKAVGRRKTSTARVRLWVRGVKGVVVNDKPYQDYFSTIELQQVTLASLEKMNVADRFRVSVKVKGGGVHSQAEAARHGIARALVKFNPNFQKRLKKAGFLTRDPRMRERKKFGLKRARKASQWRKR